MLTIISEGFGTSSARARAKAAVEAGQRCILLVPEQETLNAEAEMARLLPPSAPLYFEVTNFSRLANTVFRTLGGISYRYADGAASALLMWKTLDALAPHLHVPMRDASAVDEMLSALGELYAAGIDEEALAATARRLPEDARLRRKLEDLSLIFRIYRGELTEIYGSHSEDLDRLSLLLSENNCFPDVTFFVDAFTSFTAQEYRILEALMRKNNVTVSLTCKESGHPSLCYEETKDAISRLLSLAESAGVRAVRENGEEDVLPPSLFHAKEHLFRADKALVPYTGRADALSLWRTKNPFDAANAIAADIAARIREGAHFSDFVVFVRDAKKYTGIIDKALERQGIPFFMSLERDVFSFAAIRMIRAAYDVLCKGYRTGDVLSFLKCGFGEISPDDVDVFEIYVTFWHISGKGFGGEEPWTMSPSGYAKDVTEGEKVILARANGVREKLKDMLSVLESGSRDGDTVKTHATALYAFLDRMRCEEQLLALSEEEKALAHPAEADALERLFGVICGLLDAACETAGELSVSREQFADMLNILFSSMSFGQLPTSQDAVTVGSAEMLRARGVRFAYLLGVNEGEFPATVAAGGAFADSERKQLAELGLPLAFDPLMRASREQFCFLRALCAPKERATVITCKTDAAGGAVHPSVLFSRMEKMFGAATDIQKIEAYTPEAALELADGSGETAALSAILEGDGRFTHFLSGKDIPICDAECYIDAALANELFPKSIRMSQTRFESYSNCPFSYYCRYLLGLSEKNHADFSVLDIGTLIHAVLENLFKVLSHDGKTIKAVSREEIPRYTSEVCRAYIDEICPKEMRGSPRLLHLFSRLERSAVLISEELYDEFAQSEFTPAFFEFTIGRAGAPDPIAFDLGEGAEMLFHGQIDRIDTYKGKDGALYLRVVDYKTGEKSFSVDDVKKGKNLQMLLYLFSLWRSQNSAFAERLGLTEGTSPLPAGVMYMHTSVKDVELAAPLNVEEVKKKAKENLTRSGLTLESEEIARAMDKLLLGHFLPVKTNADGSIKWDKSFASLERMGELFGEMQAAVAEIGAGMRKGRACADPTKDGFGMGSICDSCSFKPVCRKK